MENNSIWKWIWPHAGATPVNQGLDSEMFDRADYPYSETFVREAIQNSLDARLDLSEPVRIHFTFHRDRCEQRKAFLEYVVSFREKAELEIPEQWFSGGIKWLVVEDFNSRGLSGNLADRTSDFWNYWLNFGLSNKDGSGRGGRGIGRVTFLIASRLQSVIGFTRRSEDGQYAVCGMSALRAQAEGSSFLSTHAYLANEEKDSIYRLHDSEEFHEQVREAFRFTGYEGKYTSGLALAIPYPHDELSPDRILATAIENFAPAIMNGTVVLNADGIELDMSSITRIAGDVSELMNNEAIRTDVRRYLRLINGAGKEPMPTVIRWPNQVSELKEFRNTEAVRSMQEMLDNYRSVVLDIELPLMRSGSQMDVRIKAIIANTPLEKKPLDRFFREGMSLPDVRTKSPGDLDLILLVEDKRLATYLNFCEGKAHLDLMESKEIKDKLKDKGFSDGVKLKRTVRNLPRHLRALFEPEASEPIADIFVKFFSVPEDRPARKRPKVDPNPPNTEVLPDPLPPRIPPFRVEDLPNGMRIRTNPEYETWPVNLTVRLAYADGSRRPSWNEYDFRLEDLLFNHDGCQIKVREGNRIKALDCGQDCSISVTGFDINRELDASVRWDRDAQEN